MSNLLKTYSVIIIQIMLILSVLLVFRGHNYSGGGFIGGLVAASANALYILANHERSTFFNKSPYYIAVFGVLILVASITLGPFLGQAPLQGIWFTCELLSVDIKIGTPLIFDFGIYCIILGSITGLLIELEDK